VIRGDCRCGTLRAPSPVASERAADPRRYSCVPPRLRFRMIPGYRRIPVSTRSRCRVPATIALRPEPSDVHYNNARTPTRLFL
jgi:hypothetical protein